MTRLQKMAAYAGIFGAFASAVGLWNCFGSTQSISVGVISPTGGVAIGHGNVINIGPTVADSEARRRSAVVRELIGDYMALTTTFPAKCTSVAFKSNHISTGG